MEYYAVADVALLILLFFHRYMLRKLGLWKDANVQDTFLTLTNKSFNDASTKFEEVTSSTTADTINEIDQTKEVEID